MPVQVRYLRKKGTFYFSFWSSLSPRVHNSPLSLNRNRQFLQLTSYVQLHFLFFVLISFTDAEQKRNVLACLAFSPLPFFSVRTRSRISLTCTQKSVCNCTYAAAAGITCIGEKQKGKAGESLVTPRGWKVSVGASLWGKFFLSERDGKQE